MDSRGFQEIDLGDLCIKIGSGVTPRGGGNVYKQDGISLIRSQNIYDYSFEYKGLVYIDEEQAKKMKNVEVMPDDVLLNITGDSVARCCIVPNGVLPARVNQHVSIIRPNSDLVDPRYLLYWINNSITKELLLSLASTGATRKALTKGMIEKLKLSIPPIIEQKFIASTLSCLDDKIKINNRINENLEEMAQTIFKSWFVNFDPFQEGEFEDSELGRIPKGWRVVELGEFFPVITGKKNANVSSEIGKYPFFSCSQDVAWTDDYSFEGNAILVAGNGDFNVKWYKGKFEAYQRTYVLIPYNERLTGLLFAAIKFSLDKITSGHRGSVIKFITKGSIENFKIAMPSKVEDFEIVSTFETLNNKIEFNNNQIRILTDIRDSLLPKLMSGEILVPIEEL